jgi:HTH-type transcriptional regulator/antitoxin HigA
MHERSWRVNAFPNNTLQLKPTQYNAHMADPQSLFDLRAVHPGKILRQMMDERGWKAEELASITGISRQMVYYILTGKSNVTPETAARLAAALGNSAEEWVKWDALYRLSSAEADTAGIGRMARLYDAAPIRDMQKRGWIKPTADPTELEAELTHFFGRNPIDEDVSLPIATKRTIVMPTLNAAEKAWCYRAKQLGKLVPANTFVPEMLNQSEKKLRKLAAFRKEIRHIPKVLAECGIRFLIIEPLPNVRIDGATLWIDTEPVIAMSVRHDRIDGFWFTLMHEFAHVRHGDASVDTELVDSVKGIAVRLVEEDAEKIANQEAANSLIPRTELNSFIGRVGPFYPKERVVQFAHRIKIHPGIVVGQLQHRNEIGYSALRKMLVTIRDIITSTALTDGWNQEVAPSVV